jgi:hypothetical protein
VRRNFGYKPYAAANAFARTTYAWRLIHVQIPKTKNSKNSKSLFQNVIAVSRHRMPSWALGSTDQSNMNGKYL